MGTMAKKLKDGALLSKNDDFESIETFGSLQEEIAWKDEKIKRLSNSIASLKGSNSKKKSQKTNNEKEDLAKANEKITSLNNNLNRLKREVASMRSQRRTLQQSLEESNSKENAALTAAANCEKELKTTRHVLRELSCEKEKMNAKITNIKSKLKRSEPELKNKDETLELKNRISTLVKQNALLRATIAQTKLKSEKDAVSRITKKKNMNDESTEVLQRVKNLEKQIENDKQKDKKKKSYSTLELQVKEINILRQQVPDYKAELNFIKNEKEGLLKKLNTQVASNAHLTEIKKLKNEIFLLSNRVNTKVNYDVEQNEKKMSKLTNNETQLKKEILDLRTENSRLFQDLQAFDLNFFEEIEDLKFKYNEAIRTAKK